MAKLIMMKGLPGSGKTTKAQELMNQYGNFVRVNRDLLREMLHFGKWSGRNEGITVDVQNTVVRSLLFGEQNVIVDDTNLTQKHLDRWKGIANEMKSQFEIVAMTTPVEVCLERDSQRDRQVGSTTIMNLAIEHGYYVPKKGWVLCDLDGTLCDVTGRLDYVKKEPKEWDMFFKMIPFDKLNGYVYETILGYHKNGYDVVLVTARPEKTKRDTLKWLNDWGVNFATTVIFRRDHDKRPDVDVKEDMLNRYFDITDILKVIDDRPSVIRMWQSHGLDVLDVGEGVEF